MGTSIHLSLLLAWLLASPAPAAAPPASAARTAAGEPSPSGPAARPAARKAPKKVARKKRPKRKRRCRAYANPRYKKMVRNWRKVPKIPEPRWRNGYRDLTVYSVNHGERVRVFPFLDDGTLDPSALEELEPIFRDRHSEASHPVDPRLVKLLYKLAVRFEARQITVISGFREATVGSESHHSDGTAVDFMIPGVRLAALAKVARRLGRVGVGYYPTSGFVHLDVRERSYFWADPSGPGYSGCHRQIMPKSIWKFDARWSPEDDEPVPQKNRKGELLGAVEKPAGEEPDTVAQPETP